MGLGLYVVVRAAGECIRGDMFLPLNVGDLESECQGFCFEVEESGVCNGGKFLVPKQ